MEVTVKNLEHTKAILQQMQIVLNQYGSHRSGNLLEQVVNAQKAVSDLQAKYMELECDLSGLDDYLTEQEKGCAVS